MMCQGVGGGYVLRYLAVQRGCRLSEIEAADLTKLGHEAFGYDVGNLGEGALEGRLDGGDTLEMLYRGLQSIQGVVDPDMDISPDGVMEQLRNATVVWLVHGSVPYTNHVSVSDSAPEMSPPVGCVSTFSMVSATTTSLRVVSANNANPAVAASIRTDVANFIRFLSTDFVGLLPVPDVCARSVLNYYTR